MAKCDYCGSTIVFGGAREGELRFCNGRCQSNGRMIVLSRQVPENLVHQSLWSVHQGRCPKCQGAGPVDVHVSHTVWSALLLTRWASKPQICCRACGTKSQLGATGFSLLLGWWGFPWGFVVTPIQIARNIAGMVRGPDPTNPSAQLEKAVRLTMVSNAVAANAARGASAGAESRKP